MGMGAGARDPAMSTGPAACLVEGMSPGLLLASVVLSLPGEPAAPPDGGSRGPAEEPVAESEVAPEPAQPSDEPWSALPQTVGSFALALNLGVGSAVGLMGATLSYSGLGPLEVELGVGLGLSGVQASAMLKLGLLGNRTSRFVVGLGVADTVSHQYNREVTGNPIWLNVDLLSYESRGVVFLSFALGVTRGLGGGTYDFGDSGANSLTDQVLPQVRIMMGGWGG